MLPNVLFQKLANTIQQADDAFRQYEKYTACFSIRTIDDEIACIYRSFGLSYAKLTMLMQISGHVSEPVRNDTIIAVDAAEKRMAKNTGLLKTIQRYLEANRVHIVGTLRNHDEMLKIIAELGKLEKHTEQAGKIVIRMETMLLESQQIYRNNRLDRCTA